MEIVKDSLLNEETRRKEKGESFSRVLVHEKQERQKKKKTQKGMGEVKVEISHGFRGRSKSIKSFSRSGSRGLQNSFKLSGVGFYPPLSHHETQESAHTDSEGAL